MSGKNGSSSKLATTPPFVSIPLFMPTPKAQDMESIPFHGLEETITILEDGSMPSVQTLSATLVDVPSREELDVLLKRFPTFTNMEPLTSHMNELFPILKRIPMDVTVDPQQNFMAHVPHGTTEETIEAIMHLKDYTTMQTTEMVQFFYT